jgi:hypothetical protein
MDKRILYTRAEGGLGVVAPFAGARGRVLLPSGPQGDPAAPGAPIERDETDEEFLARLIATAVPPDASDVRVVDAADVPPLPPPVPPVVTDRQLFQALAAEGLVPPAEALAAVRTGELPAAFRTVLDAMPEGERFAAEMVLSGATSFERGHPLTAAIGAGLGLSPEGIDELFRAAARA